MPIRRLLVASSAAVVLAGCGGSSTPAPAAERAASPASPAASSPGATAATSTAPAAVAGTAPTGAAPAGTAAPAPKQQSGAQPAATAATKDRATAPGAYTYDSTGTVNAGAPQRADGTATLTVDPPAGGKQHSVLAGDQGRTEQDVVVRSDGTYLARLAINNPAFSKEFRPQPVALLYPEPAAIGRSWSWTGTSTDGKTKVTATARVARTETLTIGGARTKTSVLESTFRLTGDITYTGRTTTWYDTTHLLSVKDHTKGNGTFGGVAFTTDITSVLRSTQPA